MMENIALTTLLLPFIGALITACAPKRYAKWLCTFFALIPTLGTLALGWQYWLHDKADVTYTLLSYGTVELFGFTIDRISTLIVLLSCFLASWSAFIPPAISPLVIKSIRMRGAIAITHFC